MLQQVLPPVVEDGHSFVGHRLVLLEKIRYSVRGVHPIVGWDEAYGEKSVRV